MFIKKYLFLVVFVLSIISCAPVDRYISFSGYAQGGTYTVKLNLNGVNGRIDATPEMIRDSVDAILRNLDNSVSGYNKKSLLSRFNAGEPVFPDEIFLDIYEKSYEIYELTGGIVDVSSAPLFDIWGFGFKTGEMPDEDHVEEARAASGMDRLRKNIRVLLDEEASVSGESLLQKGGSKLPQLNYNAVAQGYSCDLVAEYLYSLGVKDMMVDIGEIFCDGRNPSGKQWTIAIDSPVDGNNDPGSQVQGVFSVPQGPHGVVTSGNYRKFKIVDGKKYAHTINPKSGYPVMHNLLSATIVAKDAFSADAYATYCMTIGLDASIAFLNSHTELEGCLIYDDSGVFRVWCSDGFVLSSATL